ncbi:MAG: LytTR family transcriptional regulator DNA-binding domain-containing protein [Candidatus Gastranaerophilales bacterium]|nr:LytTR family transcriptional regulator DNA-binding domain-containing protein [Candidatus Gastranaerophilales bacterium]
MAKSKPKPKPAEKITFESLKKELDQLQNSYKSLRLLLQPKFSFITVITSDNSNEVMILKIKEILYVTTEENRLKIVTIDGKEFFNFDSLANMDKKFEGHPFFVRTHKSYFANLENVNRLKMSTYGRTLIYTLNKKNLEVPVSYTYIKKVKEYFDF